MSEKRRLKAMRDGLFEAFPNLERKGCPGPEIIRAIIAGKMAQAEEDTWVDHFVLCSPCSKEFFEIRRGHIHKRRLRAGAIISTVVLIVALSVWGWVHHEARSTNTNTVAQAGAAYALRDQVLDLRVWSGERTDNGTQRANKAPLELHRWRTSLLIYLPLGSEPGKYEIRISRNNGKPLLHLRGAARIIRGNTLLRVPVDLSKLSPGEYSLGIRQPPWDWRYLLLQVK